MKAGDLVKRFDEWVKYNVWMASPESEEIGMIVKAAKHFGMIAQAAKHSLNDELCQVLWSRSGLKVEYINDLENV